MAFYEALTDLIFTAEAGPLAAYGLKLAVEVPFRSVERPADSGVDTEDLAGEESTAPPPDLPAMGHGLSEQDLTPRVPAPSPFRRQAISPPASTTSGGDVGRKRPRRAATTAHLRYSAEEEEQKRQLKEDHYAWHCQACLGNYDVNEAVPPHTYLWSAKYRAPNIAAHHTDHLQNRVILGAWNLLVLCKYHHDALGDALSREQVRLALAQAKPSLRHFPIDKDAKSTKPIQGFIARVALDAAPHEVALFFSNLHAAIWKNPPDLVPDCSKVQSGSTSGADSTEDKLNEINGEDTDEVHVVTGVCLLITQAQKQELRKLRFAEEQIRDMKPTEAHRILGLTS